MPARPREEEAATSLTIRLLGVPSVVRDGPPVAPPRGHKPWALLAYLLRTDAPTTRQHLAGLLFPDADDPLGALRWNLSQLRRLLGESATLEGDPLRVELPAGTLVDVDILSAGSWVEAVDLPGLGQPLIEGVSLPSSPAFELWLENERRHVLGISEAVLHEAALACLARGDAGMAANHATRLVSLNPYDENSQVLLIRALRASRRLEEAARQAEACTKLFREELGVDPSPALRTAGAADATPAPRAESRGAILAKLDAGESAAAAGALQTGIEALRGAAAAARAGNDRHLLARALLALGSTLVHAARGSDEEGAAALHEGGMVAEELGLSLLAATALREIAYVELLRARYERAGLLLDRAERLAEGNDAQLAWIGAARGVCLVDTSDYEGALGSLSDAVDRAERAGARRAGAWARNLLGKLHLLKGELEAARRYLDASLEVVRAENWTSFLPFPLSLRAEIDLVQGDVDTARERFEHAFALGCQLGDPCWESIGARGLGLVAAAEGDVPKALELLDEAPRRCRRLPDSYLWLEAYAMEALCSVGIDHGAPAARRWVEELEALASHNGMRELVVRAALHRARLGDPGAFEMATALAAGIENPALSGLLQARAA